MMKLFRTIGCVAGACLWTALLMGGCRSAINEAANRKLLASLGRTSFTVYPAIVRSHSWSYDSPTAERVAAHIAGAGLGTAVLSTERIHLTGAWSRDESRMFRESAAAVAAHVRSHAPATDYAIALEYLFSGNGAVLAVHGFVVDRDGTLADGIGLNSHHAKFTAAKPKTVEDCTQMVIHVMRENWRPAGPSGTRDSRPTRSESPAGSNPS